MSMRIVGLVAVAVAVAACGAKDDAAGDSTAAAAAAAPAALTPAALAGTWAGTSMAEVGDSVTGRFTVVARPEGGGMYIAEGSKDSIPYTATFDADSSVVTSSPFSDPSAPAGSPQMMFRAVARLTGDNTMAGTSTVMLASKPDSIIMRDRWTATRQ